MAALIVQALLAGALLGQGRGQAPPPPLQPASATTPDAGLKPGAVTLVAGRATQEEMDTESDSTIFDREWLSEQYEKVDEYDEIKPFKDEKDSDSLGLLPPFDPKDGCNSWYIDVAVGYFLGALTSYSANFYDTHEAPHVDEVLAIKSFHAISSMAIEEAPRKEDTDNFWWIDPKAREEMKKFIKTENVGTTFHRFFALVQLENKAGLIDSIAVPCHSTETFEGTDLDGEKVRDRVPINLQKHTQPYCSPLSSLLGLHQSMVDLIKYRNEGQVEKEVIGLNEFKICYKDNPIQGDEEAACPTRGLEVQQAFNQIWSGVEYVDANTFTGQLLRVFDKCYAAKRVTEEGGGSKKENAAKLWAIKAERNINEEYLSEVFTQYKEEYNTAPGHQIQLQSLYMMTPKVHPGLEKRSDVGRKVEKKPSKKGKKKK